MKKSLSPKDIIVAIDVGTTKICTLIAQKVTHDQCEILGIGRAPSKGLARGIVVDVSPAIQSIKQSIQEAELMAGYTIESAYVGISGAHINAYNSSGMVPIKHGDIRESDVQKVIAAAQTIALPEGEQILHVIPQTFTIDGKHIVRDPVGMHGVRLEAKVHIITGEVTSVQNLITCCQMAGIKVKDIILEPLASADAVLSQDERDLGVGMLDIGGGTSDFAVYQNGSIRHTRIIPIAGQLFTNDIALCLRTSRTDAERIKLQFGNTCNALADEATCTVQMIDGETQKTITPRELSKILTPRAEELLRIVRQEIEKYTLSHFMPSGLVLTGGGSLLKGLIEHAHETLDIPARLGKPKVPETFRQELHNPIYATGYGLLVHAINKEKRERLAELSGPLVSRIFWKMKTWVADFF